MSSVLKNDAICGEGELAGLIRSFDWSGTKLGPIKSWPKELVSIVNVMLSAPRPILIYWGEDLVLLYNDAARPIASEKHPDALGQSAREVWNEAWHIIGPEVERVLSTGESVRHEGVLVPLRQNGVLRDMYWNYAYSPIYAEGRVGGVLLICQEITEQILAAKRMREAEALASRILQSIGDAVLVTDAEGRITRTNPVAERLTGWSSDEAVGSELKHVFRAINEATREPVEDPVLKVKRLRTVVDLADQTILVAKDGTENQIDDSASPIFEEDGSLSGMVLIFREVNERRRVELERKILTGNLNQVLETTSDGVAIIDRQWRITYLNSRGRDALGVVGRVAGQNIWETFPAMTYPDSPYVYHYYRAMDEGIAGEFTTVYPEPLHITVQINVVPSSDGIIVFFRDITEQKRRADGLILAEKLVAVGKMASSIAHEINNPLEAVMNLLYIARMTQEKSEVGPLLDDADRELRRVANIVNQTLRFHRQATSPRIVRCDELFTTVLDLYQSRLKNSGVRLEKRKRAGKPVVVYEGDVRQVLNNLVGNAIDAMPKGGRLVVRSRDSTDWRTGRAGLTLTIADDGEGIDPETRRRIFEAFFTTKGIGGTGLGLWISAEIMERHTGRILLRSSQREGHRGTVVTLFLPFAQTGAE